MTYKDLQKNGVKLAEYDSYNGGIYYATTELWLCNNYLWEHVERDNRLSYHGREKETYTLGDRDFFFMNYNPWFKCELTEEGRKALEPNEIENFDCEWMC